VHFVLMIVACGFGCSIAGSAKASILAAAFAVIGYWLAAAAVGYQQPGATLGFAEQALCAYAGPLAAIGFPILAGVLAALERRRRARLHVPAWMLCGAGLVNGYLLGLSLWGFAPYEDAGLLAAVLGLALAALGTGAAVILLRCLPPQEMRSNVVALLFGIVSVALGAAAVGDPKTTQAVSSHSYRGW
jgi:hypothetical protein